MIFLWILLALAIAGIVFQMIGLARSSRQYLPPGRMIDVGGRRLHAICAGEGSPTVVLEAGIAASSLSWARVQREVATFTRVCAYDRAGLAWSDTAPHRPTLARVLDDLHALLTKGQIAAPYVLVGHSYGGFVVSAYAARHPEQVAGLVFVDMPAPGEWIQISRQQARLLWGGIHLSRLGGVLARVGLVRACLALLSGRAPAVPRHFVKVFGPTTSRTLERLVGEVRKLPPEMHPVVQALWCQPKCFRAMADYLSLLEETAAAVAHLTPPRDLPLVVISSYDQPAARIREHAAIARHSSRGRHIIAKRSGHWVQLDEPELVVTAIREVVEAARGMAPLNSRAV